MTEPDPAALIESARARRRGGALEEAIVLQRQAVALLAGGRAGDHAHALRHLADMLCDLGEAREAAPLYAQILAFYGDADTLDGANAVRAAACNAEQLGDTARAERLWRDARSRYAALDALLVARTGGNPGAAEADARLAALSSSD